MRRLRPGRPSPAMVVALLALFVALGGVSYGVATGSIDSREIKNNTVRTKDIRNNDVRGKDIRNSTIRGSDIGADQVRGPDVKESTLGLVPHADLANFAGRALDAVNVDKLKTVGSYKRVGATSGASTTAARSAAPEVPMYSGGAFDVYGKCFQDTSSDIIYARTYIRTKVNGAILESDNTNLTGDSSTGFNNGTDASSTTPAFLDTNIGEPDREVSGTSSGANSANTDADDNTVFSAAAPDNTTIMGMASVAVKHGTTVPGNNGVYVDTDACVFYGYAVV